ncbi:NtaA/DmoA family FMN-dependent monooxygenase [Orlajensenia leifsoniae]|uniref:LLM class flavin-dependent oxidoreductase n=1 Tax=Orlajensenia leifsoniae TaxID=2561933 RepID=A0A4Y9R4X7_9MICO|nr:NtaA/DmoA family FMN-dependent monooxygenase [Leifsonia flava]TFV99691.1 LLM class flavin-dependent oxidoreductase [Leifsonia flava]
MTTPAREHIIIGAMVRALGAYPSGWRIPGAHADPRTDTAVLRRTAKLAEAAHLDYLFFGDWLATGSDLEVRDPYLLARIDPLSAITYLAGITRRIGLIATANTTYSDPYTLARATASVDALSSGRAGLNLVTGAEPRAAGNHGRDAHWGNEHRYDQATEFIEALRLLWDSWEDDAFVHDRATGRLIDPTRLHSADYNGEHVRVAGALNVVRPVQGHLPIVHAGTALRSRQLAAATADVALVAVPTLAEGVQLSSELRRQTVAAGRAADELRIISPVLPVVASTQEEAWAIFDQLLALVPLDDGSALSLSPDFPAGRGIRALSQAVGVALGPQALDAVVTRRLAERFSDLGQHLIELVAVRTGRRIGDSERPITLRHLLATHLVPSAAIVGDAGTVADHLQEWFEAGAVDGFNVLTAFHGDQFEAFTTLVIPELQRRGLFREAYAGRTLREHLGLERPANLHAAAREARAAQAELRRA